MPSEQAISNIVDIFTNVIDLGGVEERTAIIPNLSVIDAAPTGLTNFIIVQDDRDGNNILAKTVPGTIYANNDKVNVLFIKGTEPIAFQHGSESGNAALWEIVPSTSTDIFYDRGNVGIGISPQQILHISENATATTVFRHANSAAASTSNTVRYNAQANTSTQIRNMFLIDSSWNDTTDITRTSKVEFLTRDGGVLSNPITIIGSDVGIGTTGPDARLDVLATTTQLRLTHTDGSKFVDFTLDTNDDLTIGPSSTGQVIIDSDVTVSSGHDLIVPSLISHLGDLDTSISFATDLLSFIVGGETMLSLSEGAQDEVVVNEVSQDIDFRVEGSTDGNLVFTDAGNDQVGIGASSLSGKLHIDNVSAAQPVAYFDQGDVSEEMFEFATTIGVGNAIEAVGAKTLTVTHFIKVTLPGSLTRYIQVGTIAA